MPSSCWDSVTETWDTVKTTVKYRYNLWFCVFELPAAVSFIARLSQVGSVLCAMAPLFWPMCWLCGGFSDSIIVIAISGTAGMFFSTVGWYGEKLKHPGYTGIFFQFLLVRCLVITGVFIADRETLSRCELYSNSLTRRIHPNITLGRLAEDDNCHGARVYLVVRWLFDLAISCYMAYAVHLRHEELHELHPEVDLFEDPVQVMKRVRSEAANRQAARDYWQRGGSAVLAAQKLAGAMGQPTHGPPMSQPSMPSMDPSPRDPSRPRY